MEWPVAKLSIAECDAMVCKPGTLFELEDVKINGGVGKAWKHQLPTFREFLLEKIAMWKDRVLINGPVTMDNLGPREDLTFGQAGTRATALAAWLRGQGARKGSMVAIVGYNCNEWVVAFIAIHLIGGVAVMVNAATTPESMAHCLNLASPVVVLADAISAAAITANRKALKNCGKVYNWDTQASGRRLETLDFKNLKVSASAIADVKAGKGLEGLGPESDAVVFYTSGTTGLPKGVLSDQRAGLHNVISAQIPIARVALRAGAPLEFVMDLISNPPPEARSMLLAIPFFHATGCESILMKSFNDGTKLVLMKRWNVDEGVKILADYKCNIIGGVPAIATSIIQHPNLPKEIDLLGCSYGGAPPASRLAGDLKKRWPDLIAALGWGMSETNALVCGNAGMDYVVKPKSTGPVIPIAEVKIVDQETRKELPTGTVGTIVVRGSVNMKCYLGNPEATAKTVDKDGWLDTGDAGYFDKDGFLSISDRIKDIIIRGGENIASEEVENVIFLDDRIAEAAAVPVPHDVLGEEVAVAVSLAPGATATAESIIALAAPRLRSPARPVFVHVHHEPLPRNINGKLVKTDIKKIVHDKYAKRGAKAKL